MISFRLKKIVACFLIFALLPITRGYALPQGETVVSGEVYFDRSGEHSLQVTAADKAIINYDSFSIASTEAVRFIQPSTGSLVLNRVTGTTSSEITGALSSNGRVFLVNPNGIVFGSGSRLDLGGLLASTLDISDGDFLAGVYRFSSKEGVGDSFVINRGIINIVEGGSVVLQAPLAVNEGTITAKAGQVVIAGTVGSEVVFDNDELVGFILPEFTGITGDVLVPKAEVSQLIQGLVNTESVVEAGGIIEQDGVFRLVHASGLAVNDGIVSADGAEGLSAGRVLLTSSQASIVAEASRISAGGQGADSSGGKIEVLSYKLGAVGPGARLQAVGGAVSGDGGFIEVSGRDFIVHDTAVFDVSAAAGQSGMFLLDPHNVTIRANASSNQNLNNSGSPWYTTADSSVVDTGLLAQALRTGSVTIQTRTDGGSAQAGNINVTGSVDINGAAGNQLVLQAHNNITLDVPVFVDSNTSSVDPVGLVLTADRDSNGTGSVDINAAVNTFGGAFSSSGINFDNTGGSITTAGGSVSVANTGAITIGSSIDTTGPTGGGINFSAPATLLLKSDLRTDGGNIRVQSGTIIIGSSVTLDTESGNNNDAGDILLVERGISASAAGYDLTLDTRTGEGFQSGDISVGTINAAAGAFLNDIVITALGGSADPFTNCGTITLDGDVLVDEDGAGIPGSISINAKVRMTASVRIDTEQGNDADAGTISMPYANMAAADDNLYDLVLDTSTLLGSGGSLTWYKCGHFEGSGQAYYVRNLTVSSSGSVTAGNIALTGGATTTGPQLFTAGTGGGVSIYGNMEAIDNDITFASATPVILAAPVTIKSGTGTLTFNSTVSAGGYDLSLAGDAIDLLGGAGSVSGTGSISFAPSSAAKSVGLAGAAGDLQLSAVDIAALANGFSGIFIGRTDTGAPVRVSAAGVTFSDPVTFRAPGVGGSIIVSGSVTGIDNASVTLSSRGTPVLNGALLTDNRPITITVTAGDLLITNTAAPFDIDAGLSTLTIDLAGADKTLTVSAGAAVRAQGGVDYKADNMALSGSTDAGTARILLRQASSGRTMDLGSERAGALSLVDAELDTITAGELELGTAAAGSVFLSAEITPLAATDVSIASGGNIVFDVALQSAGNIRLSSAAILDGVNPAQYDIVAGGRVDIEATGGTIALSTNPLEVSAGGQLFAGASAAIEGISAVLSGIASDQLVHLLNQPPGVVIFNGVIMGKESVLVKDFNTLSGSIVNPYAIVSVPRFQPERSGIMNGSFLQELSSPFLTVKSQ